MPIANIGRVCISTTNMREVAQWTYSIYIWAASSARMQCTVNTLFGGDTAMDLYTFILIWLLYSWVPIHSVYYTA